MKNVLKVLIISAIGSIAFAQQPKINLQKNIDTTNISNDSLTVVSQGIIPENDSVLIDGTKYIIAEELKTHQYTDLPKAKKIDSIWMSELLNAGLYDTIYNDITNLTFEPVDDVDLPTDTLKARLERLNQKTPFNVEYNPLLESVIKTFLKNRRVSLTRIMARSKFYFPLFEQTLDNYDIPLEMKYLAIVESALDPKAKSRVGATGIWQFMYPTGKMYNLNVSSYVDERSDPIRSTEAACKYLGTLYEMFGDWDLALAAYNSGPGNVNKAIRRSGGSNNYWNLRPFLPKETAGYVPAFLATMYVMEYAKEHGFEDYGTEVAYFETDTVRVKKLITFDQISEYLEIDREEVQFFNPSYKLDIIPYIENKNYTLRLPRKAIGRFVANEDSIYARVEKELLQREKPLPELVETTDQIRYKVKSGDVLGKIAQKYGVRVSELKRWNGLRSNNIRIGQRLIIYPKKPITSSTKKTSKTSNKNTSKEYIVKSGDSLWSIAQKFPGISVKNIQEWNDISGTKLKPGTKLMLCKC